MELYTSTFCSISRSKDWQKWLKSIAPDLYSDLINFLNAKKGCRANTEKMQSIYLEIYKRNLREQFEIFISRRFPWLIKNDEPADIKKIIKKKIQRHQIAPYKKQSDSDLNKHNIFSNYKPSLLTFPQRLILTGDPSTLYNRVKEFCADKLAVDYIIINDRAYIEYFYTKYSSVIDKYPKQKRDIYKYRQRMKNV